MKLLKQNEFFDAQCIAHPIRNQKMQMSANHVDFIDQMNGTGNVQMQLNNCS